MTERGAGRLERSASTLAIGPSSLHWDGRSLAIEIDEVGAPWPARLRGRVVVTPAALHDESFALDSAGRHRWSPIAPCARVDVALESPHSRWSGPGYLDSNDGSAPLEADFRRWDWSRVRAGDGSTAVFYDVVRRDGSELGLALRFAPAGGAARVIAAPPAVALASSGWRLRRGTRSDLGQAARIVQSLEDGPFYARSLIESTLAGAVVTAVHESLDLDRFASPWVQAMLPFRMPRRAG